MLTFTPMKIALCTISTESHLFKSYALFDSVRAYSDTVLTCLVTDKVDIEQEKDVLFHTLNDLDDVVSQKIKAKYKGDKLRWALKPMYVKFLLKNGFDRVVYVDNDIFFYHSPDFLFEKLNTSDFLLTPHFYKADPTKEQNWLEANFRVGLYNAGFFGANQNAIPILEWWANCCLYAVKKSYWRGLYDDQKYLDLVPVKFENVEVVKNRGCNFAGWNCEQVELKMIENQLYINNDKLTFIHFAQLSIEQFSQTNSVVYPLYLNYLTALKKHKPNFNPTPKKITKLAIWNYLYYLRWLLVK